MAYYVTLQMLNPVTGCDACPFTNVSGIKDDTAANGGAGCGVGDVVLWNTTVAPNPIEYSCGIVSGIDCYDPESMADPPCSYSNGGHMGTVISVHGNGNTLGNCQACMTACYFLALSSGVCLSCGSGGSTTTTTAAPTTTTAAPTTTTCGPPFSGRTFKIMGTGSCCECDEITSPCDPCCEEVTTTTTTAPTTTTTAAPTTTTTTSAPTTTTTTPCPCPWNCWMNRYSPPGTSGAPAAWQVGDTVKCCAYTNGCKTSRLNYNGVDYGLGPTDYSCTPPCEGCWRVVNATLANQVGGNCDPSIPQSGCQVNGSDGSPGGPTDWWYVSPNLCPSTVWEWLPNCDDCPCTTTTAAPTTTTTTSAPTTTTTTGSPCCNMGSPFEAVTCLNQETIYVCNSATTPLLGPGDFGIAILCTDSTDEVCVEIVDHYYGVETPTREVTLACDSCDCNNCNGGGGSTTTTTTTTASPCCDPGVDTIWDVTECAEDPIANPGGDCETWTDEGTVYNLCEPANLLVPGGLFPGDRVRAKDCDGNLDTACYVLNFIVLEETHQMKGEIIYKADPNNCCCEEPY